VIALLILALFAGGLAISCAWADSQPPTDDDEFVQSVHCTVTDKEPTRT
jgi:hypothetical protein